MPARPISKPGVPWPALKCRLWNLAVGLTVAGFCAASAFVLYDLHEDTRERAVTGGINLLNVLSQDVARNVEMYDLSLRAVVDGLEEPSLADLSPRVQDLLLYDRAARASDLGAMLVLDRDGRVVRGSEPGFLGADLSDRAYFRAQKADPARGLYISAPFRRRVTGGDEVIGLSRAIRAKDGSFSGVVVGTIRLSYIRSLFSKADLGRGGAVNLFLADGTAVMRVPYDPASIGRSIAGTANFERLSSAPSGTFAAASTVDGVRRIYSFARVGALPLILDVALSEDEVFAAWRTKTLVIGLALMALCATAAALARLRSRSEAEYRLLADNALDVVIRLDASLRRTYVSPSCRAVLGYAPSDLVGRGSAELAHPDDWPTVERWVEQVRTGRAPGAVVYRMRHGGGGWTWVESRCSAVADGLGFLAVLRDVSERKRVEERAASLNAELARLAHSDGLTGLANRRRFDEALEAAWSAFARDGRPVSLLLLDVDRFKLFNDRYGHQEGDVCLRAVAGAVAGAVRHPGGLVARYGGEEVAVVLAGAGEAEAAAEAERVRAAVEGLALPHAGNGPCGGVVTLSVGCATADSPGAFASAAALVAAADVRLYEAKRTGRNRVATALPEAGTAPAEVEQDRLEALATYAGHPAAAAEADLDRISRLAAHVFGAPVAFVSLVGRDAVTKAGRHAVGADPVARGDAFCTQTVLSDEPLVIPDASADPRFTSSALVRDGVRFYAGAPLIDPADGSRLGAMCVVDTVPRRALDAGERDVLSGFARLAMGELMRRRAEAPDGEARLGEVA